MAGGDIVLSVGSGVGSDSEIKLMAGTTELKLDNTNGVVIANTLTVDSLVETSDGRLKRQVKQLSNALEQLKKIRGVEFYWNTDIDVAKNFSRSKQIGFIAQEVQVAVSDVVLPILNNSYLGVKYTSLIPVIVEAMREVDANQYSENQKILNRLKELTQQISMLKLRNEELGSAAISSLSSQLEYRIDEIHQYYSSMSLHAFFIVMIFSVVIHLLIGIRVGVRCFK